MRPPGVASGESPSPTPSPAPSPIWISSASQPTPSPQVSQSLASPQSQPSNSRKRKRFEISLVRDPPPAEEEEEEAHDASSQPLPKRQRIADTMRAEIISSSSSSSIRIKQEERRSEANGSESLSPREWSQPISDSSGVTNQPELEGDGYERDDGMTPIELDSSAAEWNRSSGTASEEVLVDDSDLTPHEIDPASELVVEFDCDLVLEQWRQKCREEEQAEAEAEALAAKRSRSFLLDMTDSQAEDELRRVFTKQDFLRMQVVRFVPTHESRPSLERS